jgi:hypothetical protein
MTMPINPRSSVCTWPFDYVKINYKITRDRLCMYSNIKIFVDVVVGKLFLYISVFLISNLPIMWPSQTEQKGCWPTLTRSLQKEKWFYEDCSESRLFTRNWVHFQASLLLSFVNQCQMSILFPCIYVGFIPEEHWTVTLKGRSTFDI